MSIRRVLRVITLAFALAFAFGATGAADTAFACDPHATGGGFC
jgi:hypothetical protein